jgi:phosphoribosylanthranilate isomerase
MVQVKVCGITNPDDARASVDAGAYALGFNFYPKSPRYIEPVQAARIIEQLPKSVLAVGVFVNESNSEAIQTAVQTAGVRAVQLHGDESPSFCKTLTGLFVIKALRVDHDFDPAEAATFKTDAVLLDAFGAGMYGGSGKIFDWTVAARTKPLVKKLFLAGGLNSTNVGQAIITVRPYAVDVCSGVESAPGQKDVKKLSAFMDATRKANR